MYKVSQGPFMVEAPWEPFHDTLIAYMGITLARGFDLATCEFNPSPGEYNVDAVRPELERKQYLHRVADSLGEVFREAPCVRTPAPWMKWNNACTAEQPLTNDTTNSLKPEHYADFGAMCSAFVRIAKDSFDVPIYAFSFQNEPRFNVPYPSCTYRNAQHWKDMLKVAAPAVKRADPAILIYGVEDVQYVYPGWEMAIVNDAETAPYLDRFALHIAHSDTVHYSSLTRSYPRDQWISEFNWHTMNYDTCFDKFAGGVMYRLGDGGNITGYLAGGGKVLWDGGNFGGGTGPHSPSFYFHCQLMRFVRPGMTRVKATSDEPSLRVLAYKNDIRGSFSLVMLNATSEDLEVTLHSTGTIPDSLEMRTTTDTTAAGGFVEGPLQDGKSPITVPAKGIVSLGYRIRGQQPVGIRRSPSPRVPTVRETAPRVRHMFDLRGRLLRGETARVGKGTAASGVMLLRTGGQAGTVCRIVRER